MTCNLCGQTRPGLEAIARHLADEHDAEPPERWRDGALVLNTTAAADDFAQQAP